MTCKHCGQLIMVKEFDVYKTPSHTPSGVVFGILYLHCTCRIWIYNIYDKPIVVKHDDFRKQRREDATDH